MPRVTRNSRQAAPVAAAVMILLGASPARAAMPGDVPLEVRVSSTSEIRRSQPMRGEQGGMLVAGRFWLWVPAGAWKGDAQVTLLVPEPGRLVADVQVEPEPEGGFAVPLHLFVGLADPSDVRSATFASWNADRHDWRPFADVSRDPGKRELKAVLTRPARCAVLATTVARR